MLMFRAFWDLMRRRGHEYEVKVSAGAALCLAMYEGEGYTVRGRKNEPNGCKLYRLDADDFFDVSDPIFL